MKTDIKEDNPYANLWKEAKKFFTLEIDYAKLTAIEKLTVILSAMAVVGVALILIACILFYLSSALVTLISAWLGGCMWGANLIVGGLFIILLIIVYAMRKSLIIDPVTRFITKLFLNPND
jgi:hypothetical protein